jgi:DNA-binding PadR family transcriptional regulator
MSDVAFGELTAFQIDALFVIASKGGTPEATADTAPRGLAIKERLDTEYDEKVNHGRLYPNLDQLVEQGLVEKDQKDRRTNAYALTEHGVGVLEHRINWEDECLAAGFSG